MYIADRGYSTPPPPFVDMSSINRFLFLSLIDAFLLPTKTITTVWIVKVVHDKHAILYIYYFFYSSVYGFIFVSGKM